MQDVAFIPLSALASERIGPEAMRLDAAPIIFGREAVVLDANPAALERLNPERRQIGVGKLLAAVVQKGRLFQQTYPDADVLRDRGRFLLVALDPAHPALTNPSGEPCFAAYRVEPGAEVFREVGPADRPATRDPALQPVLDALSIATFQATITELVAFRTRLSTSAQYRSAAEMCLSRLTNFGYATTLSEFAMPGGATFNVIAVPPGGAPVRAWVMAHLDSVNHVDGPAAAAPGADDNASGSAGLVAMAEALVSVAPRFPIGFALYGGEEQGLLGSVNHLASMSSDARAALRALVNMDMIGRANAAPGARQGVLIEGAEVSRAVIDGLARQAAVWTDLAVEVSLNPFASDHVPFIEAGLPAVLTIEGADQSNSDIHGPNDTLDRIDAAFAHSILRMNTAFLATLANEHTA